MKETIIKIVISIALHFLLQNTKVRDILAMVEDAELNKDNAFARRGQVYRQLKEREGDDVRVSDLNMALELGVGLYRLINKK